MGHGFYNDTEAEKRVVFPGGYIVSGPYLHIAFGKKIMPRLLKRKYGLLRLTSNDFNLF